MAMGRVGESTPSWFRRVRVSSKVWRRRLRRWERHLIRNAVFVLFEPGLPAPEPQAFYELNLTGGITSRAVLVSMGLHILLMTTPAPEWLESIGVQLQSPAETEVEEQQLATSHVLPPIYPRRMPKREPSPGGREGEPLPPRGAESVQAQTIVSTPPNPNHPRQTLLQQFPRQRLRARAETRLPNMVLPDDPAATPVPEIDLQRLRVPGAPLDTSGPPRAPAPPRPRVNASQLSLRAAKPANPIPRLTLPEAAGADDVGTGPNVNVPPGVPRSGDLAAPGVLALSASPAAPQRVIRLPDENLRARFVAGPNAGSGSPGGVPGGTPGASGGSGGGPGGIAGGGEGLIVPHILVTPAGDVPPGPVIVGPQGGGAPPAPRREAAESRPPGGSRAGSPGAGAASTPPAPPPSPQERGRALQEAVHAGGAGPRRLYVTYLYLANLTSQSSSWLLQFAESLVGNPASSAEALLVPPQVRKKVDPCYPSEVEFKERVEGVVVVYGLIRPDGRVDDAVVMRGINPRIDQAALEAFSRSLFEPARKRGKAVAIDALVEIPFRFAPCQ